MEKKKKKTYLEEVMKNHKNTSVNLAAVQRQCRK